MHIPVIHIPVRQENPVAYRQIDVYVDSHPRTQGSPSVVSAARSPGHPGGRPFVSGDPGPSVVVVVEPPPVVERRPTPGIIGHPGVPVVGHHPIPVGRIRMEITSHSWYPDITVNAVSHPPAVRPQGIVKDLNADPAPVIVVVITVIVAVITVIIIVVVITVIPVVTVLGISPALKSHAGCEQCRCKDDRDGVHQLFHIRKY